MNEHTRGKLLVYIGDFILPRRTRRGSITMVNKNPCSKLRGNVLVNVCLPVK
jgi:hypothetical protein